MQCVHVHVSGSEAGQPRCGHLRPGERCRTASEDDVATITLLFGNECGLVHSKRSGLVALSTAKWHCRA